MKRRKTSTKTEQHAEFNPQELFAAILNGSNEAWLTYESFYKDSDVQVENDFIEFIFASDLMQNCIATYTARQKSHDSKKAQQRMVGTVQDPSKSSLYKVNRDRLAESLKLIPHEYLFSLLERAVANNTNAAIPTWCFVSVRHSDAAAEMKHNKRKFKYIFLYDNESPALQFYDTTKGNLLEQIDLNSATPESKTFPLREPDALTEEEKTALHHTVAYYYTITAPTLICLNYLESKEYFRAYSLQAMLELSLKPKINFKRARVILQSGLNNYQRFYRDKINEVDPMILQFKRLLELCDQRIADRNAWLTEIEKDLNYRALSRCNSSLRSTAIMIQWFDLMDEEQQTNKISSTDKKKKKRGGLKRKLTLDLAEEKLLRSDTVTDASSSHTLSSSSFINDDSPLKAVKLTRTGTIILGKRDSLERKKTPILSRTDTLILRDSPSDEDLSRTNTPLIIDDDDSSKRDAPPPLRRASTLIFN